MTDEELRNYLGMLSFLLAGLSFLAGERRDAIKALHERGNVPCGEKVAAVTSVVLLFSPRSRWWCSAWPAVHATGLGLDDLVRLRTAAAQAFVTGWVLLIAVTLALGGLVWRAWKIDLGEAGE